jgi:hypothetical protein
MATSRVVAAAEGSLVSALEARAASVSRQTAAGVASQVRIAAAEATLLAAIEARAASILSGVGGRSGGFAGGVPAALPRPTPPAIGAPNRFNSFSGGPLTGTAVAGAVPQVVAASNLAAWERSRAIETTGYPMANAARSSKRLVIPQTLTSVPGVTFGMRRSVENAATYLGIDPDAARFGQARFDMADFVAKQNGRVIGSSSLIMPKGVAGFNNSILDNVAVAPEFRGTGLASALSSLALPFQETRFDRKLPLVTSSLSRDSAPIVSGVSGRSIRNTWGGPGDDFEEIYARELLAERQARLAEFGQRVPQRPELYVPYKTRGGFAGTVDLDRLITEGPASAIVPFDTQYANAARSTNRGLVAPMRQVAAIQQLYRDNPVIDQIFKAYGNEAVYPVGGPIRDALRGIKPNDIDFTTPVLPERSQQILRPLGSIAGDAGMKHGTAVVNIPNIGDIEVTTHRFGTADEKGDVKQYTKSLREDLARRDFTVNAMAADRQGNLIDPFGGVRDLRRQIIRTVGDPVQRFSEDPLRIIRAQRQAATFGPGWTIDPATISGAQQVASRLPELSRERFNLEMAKILKSDEGALGRSLAFGDQLGSNEALFGPLLPGARALSGMTGVSPGNRLAAMMNLAGINPKDLSGEGPLTMRLPKDETQRAVRINSAIRDRQQGLTPNALVRRYTDDEIAAASQIVPSTGVGLEQALGIKDQLRQPLPITGNDLKGQFKGREIKDALDRAEAEFAARGGQLTREQALLAAGGQPFSNAARARGPAGILPGRELRPGAPLKAGFGNAPTIIGPAKSPIGVGRDFVHGVPSYKQIVSNLTKFGSALPDDLLEAGANWFPSMAERIKSTSSSSRVLGRRVSFEQGATATAIVSPNFDWNANNVHALEELVKISNNPEQTRMIRQDAEAQAAARRVGKTRERSPAVKAMLKEYAPKLAPAYSANIVKGIDVLQGLTPWETAIDPISAPKTFNFRNSFLEPNGDWMTVDGHIDNLAANSKRPWGYSTGIARIGNYNRVADGMRATRQALALTDPRFAELSPPAFMAGMWSGSKATGSKLLIPEGRGSSMVGQKYWTEDSRYASAGIYFPRSVEDLKLGYPYGEPKKFASRKLDLTQWKPEDLEKFGLSSQRFSNAARGRRTPGSGQQALGFITPLGAKVRRQEIEGALRPSSVMTASGSIVSTPPTYTGIQPSSGFWPDWYADQQLLSNAARSLSPAQATRIDQLSNIRNFSGFGEAEAKLASGTSGLMLSTMPELAERIGSIGTNSTVTGITQADMVLPNGGMIAGLTKTGGSGPAHIALNKDITNSIVARSAGWNAGAPHVGSIVSHEITHVLEGLGRQRVLQSARRGGSAAWGAPNIDSLIQKYWDQYGETVDQFLPRDQRGFSSARARLLKREVSGYAANSYLRDNIFSEAIAESGGAVWTGKTSPLATELYNQAVEMSGISPILTPNQIRAGRRVSIDESDVARRIRLDNYSGRRSEIAASSGAFGLFSNAARPSRPSKALRDAYNTVDYEETLALYGADIADDAAYRYTRQEIDQKNSAYNDARSRFLETYSEDGDPTSGQVKGRLPDIQAIATEARRGNRSAWDKLRAGQWGDYVERYVAIDNEGLPILADRSSKRFGRKKGDVVYNETLTRRRANQLPYQDIGQYLGDERALIDSQLSGVAPFNPKNVQFPPVEMVSGQGGTFTGSRSLISGQLVDPANPLAYLMDDARSVVAAKSADVPKRSILNLADDQWNEYQARVRNLVASRPSDQARAAIAERARVRDMMTLEDIAGADSSLISNRLASLEELGSLVAIGDDRPFRRRAITRSRAGRRPTRRPGPDQERLDVSVPRVRVPSRGYVNETIPPEMLQGGLLLGDSGNLRSLLESEARIFGVTDIGAQAPVDLADARRRVRPIETPVEIRQRVRRETQIPVAARPLSKTPTAEIEGLLAPSMYEAFDAPAISSIYEGIDRLRASSPALFQSAVEGFNRFKASENLQGDALDVWNAAGITAGGSTAGGTPYASPRSLFRGGTPGLETAFGGLIQPLSVSNGGLFGAMSPVGAERLGIQVGDIGAALRDSTGQYRAVGVSPQNLSGAGVYGMVDPSLQGRVIHELAHTSMGNQMVRRSMERYAAAQGVVVDPKTGALSGPDALFPSDRSRVDLDEWVAEAVTANTQGIAGPRGTRVRVNPEVAAIAAELEKTRSLANSSARLLAFKDAVASGAISDWKYDDNGRQRSVVPPRFQNNPEVLEAIAQAESWSQVAAAFPDTTKAQNVGANIVSKAKPIASEVAKTADLITEPKLPPSTARSLLESQQKQRELALSAWRDSLNSDVGISDLDEVLSPIPQRLPRGILSESIRSREAFEVSPRQAALTSISDSSLRGRVEDLLARSDARRVSGGPSKEDIEFARVQRSVNRREWGERTTVSSVYGRPEGVSVGLTGNELKAINRGFVPAPSGMGPESEVWQLARRGAFDQAAEVQRAIQAGMVSLGDPDIIAKAGYEAAGLKTALEDPTLSRRQRASYQRQYDATVSGYGLTSADVAIGGFRRFAEFDDGIQGADPSRAPRVAPVGYTDWLQRSIDTGQNIYGPYVPSGAGGGAGGAGGGGFGGGGFGGDGYGGGYSGGYGGRRWSGNYATGKPSRFTALRQAVRGDDSAGGYFAEGALQSMKYAIPSMLMFGAAGGLVASVKEAEELKFALARLDSQLTQTFGEAAKGKIDGIKESIVNLAKETGVGADEIAKMEIGIRGAFEGEVLEGAGGRRVTGEALIKEQREAATKLSVVADLPTKTINDELTAISLSFGQTNEIIGNKLTAVASESGVDVASQVEFLASIAPIAEQAGFSSDEIISIGATVAQTSGRTGGALAEQLGRVLPSVPGNKDALLQLAYNDPGFGPEFIDALREGTTADVFKALPSALPNITQQSEEQLYSLLGGRREAGVVIGAFAKPDNTRRFEERAGDSDGALNARFERQKDTLTTQMRILGEQFRTLMVYAMDAGLEDMFNVFIDTLIVVSKVATPIAGVFTAINEALGGMPAKILGAVAAWKLLRMAMHHVGEVRDRANANYLNALGNPEPRAGYGGVVQTRTLASGTLVGLGPDGRIVQPSTSGKAIPAQMLSTPTPGYGGVVATQVDNRGRVIGLAEDGRQVRRPSIWMPDSFAQYGSNIAYAYNDRSAFGRPTPPNPFSGLAGVAGGVGAWVAPRIDRFGELREGYRSQGLTSPLSGGIGSSLAAAGFMGREAVVSRIAERRRSLRSAFGSTSFGKIYNDLRQPLIGYQQPGSGMVGAGFAAMQAAGLPMPPDRRVGASRAVALRGATAVFGAGIARAGGAALAGAVGTLAANPFMAIMALGAIYSTINGIVDNHNQQMKEVAKEVREGNQKAIDVERASGAVAVSSGGAVDRRISSLRRQANREERTTGWWERTWKGALGLDVDEADILRYEANQLEFTAQTPGAFERLEIRDRIKAADPGILDSLRRDYETRNLVTADLFSENDLENVDDPQSLINKYIDAEVNGSVVTDREDPQVVAAARQRMMAEVSSNSTAGLIGEFSTDAIEEGRAELYARARQEGSFTGVHAQRDGQGNLSAPATALGGSAGNWEPNSQAARAMLRVYEEDFGSTLSPELMQVLSAEDRDAEIDVLTEGGKSLTEEEQRFVNEQKDRETKDWYNNPVLQKRLSEAEAAQRSRRETLQFSVDRAGTRLSAGLTGVEGFREEGLAALTTMREGMYSAGSSPSPEDIEAYSKIRAEFYANLSSSLKAEVDKALQINEIFGASSTILSVQQVEQYTKLLQDADFQDSGKRLEAIQGLMESRLTFFGNMASLGESDENIIEAIQNDESTQTAISAAIRDEFVARDEIKQGLGIFGKYDSARTVTPLAGDTFVDADGKQWAYNEDSDRFFGTDLSEQSLLPSVAPSLTVDQALGQGYVAPPEDGELWVRDDKFYRYSASRQEWVRKAGEEEGAADFEVPAAEVYMAARRGEPVDTGSYELTISNDQARAEGFIPQGTLTGGGLSPNLMSLYGSPEEYVDSVVEIAGSDATGMRQYYADDIGDSYNATFRELEAIQAMPESEITDEVEARRAELQKNLGALYSLLALMGEAGGYEWDSVIAGAAKPIVISADYQEAIRNQQVEQAAQKAERDNNANWTEREARIQATLSGDDSALGQAAIDAAKTRRNNVEADRQAALAASRLNREARKDAGEEITPEEEEAAEEAINAAYNIEAKNADLDVRQAEADEVARKREKAKQERQQRVSVRQAELNAKGDTLGAAQAGFDFATEELEIAKATGTVSEQQAAQVAWWNAWRGLQDAQTAAATRVFRLANSLSRNPLQIAQNNVQAALASRNQFAPGTAEWGEANIAVNQSIMEEQNVSRGIRRSQYSLEQAGWAGRDGIRGIQRQQRMNTFDLRQAWSDGDSAQVFALVEQAGDLQKQLEDAFIARASALSRLKMKRTGADLDPVQTSVGEVDILKRELDFARKAGDTDRAIDIEMRLIDAQRASDDAMNDVRLSFLDLRQAELSAMEDEVGAAQIARQQAQQQLDDALSRGAGDAEINRLRARAITADKAAQDAVYNDRRDEYSYMLEMNEISKSTYMEHIRNLQSTVIPGSKKFKELELELKRLKDDMSSDLSVNLPSTLGLPTVYEIRRMSQQTGFGPGGNVAAYNSNSVVNYQIGQVILAPGQTVEQAMPRGSATVQAPLPSGPGITSSTTVRN